MVLAKDDTKASESKTAPEEDGRWSELLRPDYLATTAALCLGVALFAFNEFFVATALPTAVEEIGGATILSWAVTLYLVFAILGGAVAANLKARFGARTTLIAAAIVFVVGTIIATAAGSMPQVLAGRVFQGFGEGIIAAICYALIPELFPARLVPKVFGAEAIVWATAAFGGPLVSGFLTEHWSWRAAFAVNIPATAIFVALVLAIVPARKAATTVKPRPIPLMRLTVVGTGILLISVSNTAGSIPLMTAALATALTILWAAVATDRRAEHSILPAGAFALTKPLGTGLWVVLLMPLAQASGSIYLIYGLQHVWSFSPTAAGFAGALMAISWSLTAILVASLRSHDLRVKLIPTGPALLSLGLAGLMIAFAIDDFRLVFPSQIAVGAGFGISWGTLSQLMMDVSSRGERDKTSAFLPTLQSAGYAIGAAICGLTANLRGFDENADIATMHGALFTVFVVACLISTASLYLGLRTVRLAARRSRHDRAKIAAQAFAGD